jgi:hypothetical protein
MATSMVRTASPAADSVTVRRPLREDSSTVTVISAALDRAISPTTSTR